MPEPANVLAYNRYMYALGNPLKYSDPSGYYSDDALYAHFNCTDWQCVEGHFQKGGSHEGLWGWLDILRTAEDGDSIEILALSGGDEYVRASGRFKTVDGNIMVENGTVALLNGQTQIGGYALGGSVAEQGFASLAHLNVGGARAQSAIYMMSGYGSTGYQDRALDCDHTDCAGRAANAASMGVALVGAGCAIATAGACVAVTAGVSFGLDSLNIFRTYSDYNAGDATAADLTVSIVTAGAGAILPSETGPAIAGLQWWWDER